jgi:uncharacterized membrane protein YhaH (DUF805 family)
MEWMLMPLKRYADFSGRSRRMEFWMWKLGLFIVYVVMMVLFSVVFGSAVMAGDPSQAGGAIAGLMVMWGLLTIFGLAILIPDLAVTVRRLHDTNRTGWWILAPVIPYAVAFFTIFSAAASGSEGGMMAGGLIGVLSILAAVGLAITVLVFMFLEGTKGPNKYGADPKGQDTGQVFA